jgi:hypothetical protein
MLRNRWKKLDKQAKIKDEPMDCDEIWRMLDTPEFQEDMFSFVFEL